MCQRFEIWEWIFIEFELSIVTWLGQALNGYFGYRGEVVCKRKEDQSPEEQLSTLLNNLEEKSDAIN